VTVVRDGDVQLVGVPADLDRHRCRVGVPHDVGQRLLHDAERGQLDRRREGCAIAAGRTTDIATERDREPGHARPLDQIR